MDYNGKVVVFVGGLGSIASEVCKRIIKKDIAYLVLLDAVENPSAVEKLQSMNKKCRVMCIKIDLSSRSSIQHGIAATVKETKYIDILINGAGILKESNVELTVQINLIGLINTTYEALPYMDKCKSGRGGLIVNLSSTSGIIPSPALSCYSSTKFAVIGFSRCLAHPHFYNTTGVAVTAICPGFIETPLLDNIKNNCTFDYSVPIVEKFATQYGFESKEICAEHFIQIIDANKNGSVWMSDVGKLTELQLKVYWTPTIKGVA